MSTLGTVYNIQPYSIHDGPGIRTVVFMKGCPLSCIWCSNPESQCVEPQVYYSPVRCIRCSTCIQACPQKALSMANEIQIDRNRCIACGTCQQICPTEAISISGRKITPDELIADIEKDRKYLTMSGGGVTFSGGEPFLQHEFLFETASKLKAKGYHIAVETCGYSPLPHILHCLESIDLLLYDIKLLDERKHQETTGKSNALILENIRSLHEKVNIIFRTPVIPGVNDNKKEMESIASFITEINPEAAVNLLPYHSLGASKYQNIGQKYLMEDIQPPEEAKMNELSDIFTAKGLHCEIL